MAQPRCTTCIHTKMCFARHQIEHIAMKLCSGWKHYGDKPKHEENKDLLLRTLAKVCDDYDGGKEE